MALYHFSAKAFSRSGGKTVRAVAYRAGCKLVDPQTGERFDYKNKEVQHVELLLPKDAPSWALEVQKVMEVDRQKGVQAFVDVVEGAEKRMNSRVWREFEFSLHRELTHEQNMALAREFVEDQICSRGMAAQLNFHSGSSPRTSPETNFDIDEKTEEDHLHEDYPQEKPHCHVIVTTRHLSEKGMGEKERDWNKKELLCELRQQWQEYSNFHLKLNGHDLSVDHRSNKARGIEMEPQPKRGKNILEQERRLEGSGQPPLTEKGKEFHDCKLRNLYRIMRRPDVVLEIASKHNSTFMWADVQKVLHRYVDELPLFQKLESKLKNSSELMTLRPEGIEPGDKAIYTTRTLLKAEKSLVETADRLAQSTRHGVEEHHTVQAISKANEALKEHGGLSEDQKKAITHMVDKGQIKCVVGIAGAGKTTALGVCHDIWKAEGYAVYGLAPTGKAAQNLEQGGISSTTLHKFLKSYEEGRYQYKSNSVLVLDEAGMVDMERFEKLLGAVNQLGVKLIVVGDGAQLQPVEAGPAFRLVTTRLGKVELTTVLRQKEEWQREATVLFGKQDTQEAIQKYMDKGHVHIVEEKLPSFYEAVDSGDREGVVKLYEVSSRTSSLIYREMAKDVKKTHPQETNRFSPIQQHQDFGRYMEWKSLQKSSAAQILKEGEDYSPLLETRGLDPTKMATLFVDKKLDRVAQQEAVITLLQERGLGSLVGVEKQQGLRPGQGIDVRQDAKAALIRAWHDGFRSLETESLDNPSLSKHAVMLAFSNRDVNDLNQTARSLLKDSGHISKDEFTYTISKRIEDDFGRKRATREEKNFSKGDRIVFTRNTQSLGVKNGTMGTITGLDKQTIQVKLDEGKEISFAPKLNPYFDQGWGITIHKSQGTTVEQTYLLASYEMTQNLAYVAMTRHQENVHLFGSSLDFWRPEKLPEVLSKSGEKLSAGDYLDAESLNTLMQRDDRLLTKIFERVSNELDAMGAVSKKAFWQVADHFLGTKREQEIRITPELSQSSIREEVRAEELLQAKTKVSSPQAVPQDIVISQSSKILTPQSSKSFIEASLVETALKQNMASFSDDIFSSIGEPYNPAVSSSVERRYGKNGHIAVNLKTGAWIDHKDSDKSGGPLHMLTKLKGLEFKEAVEYGASWAGLSGPGAPQTGIRDTSSKPLAYTSQADEKEALDKEAKAKIEKAQALWTQGRPIQGTFAERYLREHRKIEGPLSDDLRYFSFFTDSHSQWSFPCLMAGARSQSGEITAVQITFLNPTTAAKADIPVTKRSFGVVKGSAVTLQEGSIIESPFNGSSLNEDKTLKVLFVAEGVETALSLKAAGVQGTIKASLGLSNIKKIVPESPHTHIVICADHDAPDSPAAKSLEQSVLALQERGLTVTVIKPDKLMQDFNDVLKAEGPQGVRDTLERGLPKDLIKFVPQEKDVYQEVPPLEKHEVEKKTIEKVATALPQNSEGKATPSFQEVKRQELNFEALVGLCEKRLYNFLERENIELTPQRTTRISLQAERMATFILHSHDLSGSLPPEDKMVQFSMRAKYEVNRLPEIQQDIMDEGEENAFRAYRVAERLASIEGRLTFEAMQKGIEPPLHLSYVAKKELAQHRKQLPHLTQELKEKHFLSDTAAQHCAQDIVRYKEIHSENPSGGQIAKMVQISREVENKEYGHLSSSRDVAEIAFLRRREGDLLFKHGSSHDTSRALIQSQNQVTKSLEHIERQMRQEHEHMSQKDLSL